MEVRPSFRRSKGAATGRRLTMNDGTALAKGAAKTRGIGLPGVTEAQRGWNRGGAVLGQGHSRLREDEMEIR